MVPNAPELRLPFGARKFVWLNRLNASSRNSNDVGPAIEWAALARIGEYVGAPARFDSVEQAADALWQLSPTFGPHSKEQWLALTVPMLKPADGGGWQPHYDPRIGLALKSVSAETVRQGEAGLWQIYDQIKARTLVTRGAASDLLSRRT